MFFRNDNLGAKLSKLGIELFGSHMGKAFLSREQIDSLRTTGVELETKRGLQRRHGQLRALARGVTG